MGGEGIDSNIESVIIATSATLNRQQAFAYTCVCVCVCVFNVVNSKTIK